ncbi:mitochondrial 39-S ribosomal protein L47 (MRP-L47)-domain-containing protein [Phellopilus nigrolimitatus]|nr:mitochondrial 39-S ribosomal protein L47 (MRP-L47)-domain-containing protein [Phellopilus nigrolimitatus]
MLSALRSTVARRRPAHLLNTRRCLATETSMPAAEEDSEEKQRERYEKFLEQKAQELPTRPQLNISVDKDHGLYAFFRQVPIDGGEKTTYETVESKHKPSTKTGRSWNATELRRKSFKDLHTLWYIVLRERNLLATQRAETKRLSVSDEYIDISEKDLRCRKTMARIKQILNERRLAYEQAYGLGYEKYAKSSEKAEARVAARKERNGVEEKERMLDEEKAKAAQLKARRRSQLVRVTEISPSSPAPTRGRLNATRLLAREENAGTKDSSATL